MEKPSMPQSQSHNSSGELGTVVQLRSLQGKADNNYNFMYSLHVLLGLPSGLGAWFMALDGCGLKDIPSRKC